MINTLLGKVSDLLEKDFLFASLLPALLFLTAIGGTLFAVLGAETTWTFIAQLNANQLAVFATVGTIGLLVLSYALNAVRTTYAKFWAGSPSLFDLLGLFHEIGKNRHWQRYQMLKKKAEQQSPWDQIRKDFETQVLKCWNATLPKNAPENVIDNLIEQFNRVRPSLGSGVSKVQRTFDLIYAAYQIYEPNSLQPVFAHIKASLLEWHNTRSSQAQTARFERDRSYGILGKPAPTELGNVMASYNQYSYSRYQMEAEIYWPRLRAVIPKEYLAVVEEPRILLDFALTNASLSLIYSAIVLMVGPWLWFHWIWLLLAFAGGLVALMFYRIGVGAAYRFGELVRSSFDLYRLDLMKALNLPTPPTHAQELAQWRQVDQLIVYGDQNDFIIQKQP